MLQLVCTLVVQLGTSTYTQISVIERGKLRQDQLPHRVCIQFWFPPNFCMLYVRNTLFGIRVPSVLYIPTECPLSTCSLLVSLLFDIFHLFNIHVRVCHVRWNIMVLRYTYIYTVYMFLSNLKVNQLNNVHVLQCLHNLYLSQQVISGHFIQFSSFNTLHCHYSTRRILQIWKLSSMNCWEDIGVKVFIHAIMIVITHT